MNIVTFDIIAETNAQKEHKAWTNFIKSGSVRDYLIYFECKGLLSVPCQEEIKNAYSNEWNNNR